MFPKKELDWLELRKLVSEWVGFVADYIEFIMSIRPDLKDSKTIDELKKLEHDIANSDGPFLTYEQTIRQQDKIFPFILEWNPDLERQVKEFYDATVSIARLTAKPYNSKISYDPFKLLKENEERFYLARDIITNIQNSVNVFEPRITEVYAMFYGIIATAQTVYHSVFTQFEESLRLFGLEEEYDADFIFSVSTNYNNRENEIRASLRSLRNSISHFNFKLKKSDDGKPIVILNADPEKNGVKEITFEEFKWMYFNSVFLLQTVLALQYWQAAFATLRGHFVKKRKCPKCKKGYLKIAYTKEVYETKEDPWPHIFWICSNCEKEFPYDSKRSMEN